MKKGRTYILLVISILTGLLLAATSIWSAFIYLYSIGLCTIVFMAVLLIDLLGKTSLWKGALRLLCFGYLSLFIAFLTVAARADIKRSRAKSLITNLHRYKHTSGYYPATLQEVKRGVLPEEYTYVTEANGSAFRLSYSMDGWHASTYNSRDSAWTTSD